MGTPKLKTRGGAPITTMAEALKMPGIDPRVWCSYGVVLPEQIGDDGEPIDSVIFDEELGPLVQVRLQPWNIELSCRVANSIAGDGEGEYLPFISGDEVLVLIPTGEWRGGPCIVGRLNNTTHPFPAESIAGQDPTKNTFGFKRLRTPYVQEFAASYMMRVASHGAFMLFSDSGAITIRDGSKGTLQVGPDLFGYVEGTPGEVGTETTPDPRALLQIDLTGRRVTIQVDGAQLIMNSADADANPGNTSLAAPGGFDAILGNNAAVEHVATYEAVWALLEAFAVALAPPAAGPAAITALRGAVTAGGFPLTPPSALALAAAFQAAAAIPKPPADPGTGVQIAPGVGAVLFKTG